MFQRHGVSSSVASIEAAPPTHGTVTITTTSSESLPSSSPFSASSASSTVPNSSNLSQSSAPSGRVSIPKLSAATTELLARVAGRNIRGMQQQVLLKDGQTPVSSRKLSSLNSNRNIPDTIHRKADTMRVSSTFIELPTAPFISQSRRETPAIFPNPVPTLPQTGNGISVKQPTLPKIAPKPAAAQTTSTSTLEPNGVCPHLPTQVRPPTEPQLRPLTPLAPATTILAPQNTSPLPGSSLAKPIKPTSTPRQHRGAGNGKKPPKKRKRGKGSDGEDIIRAGDSSSDESDITPTATQTKSGRQVNRPSLYVPPPLLPAVPKENLNTPRAPDKPQETTKKRKRVFRKGKNTSIICKYCQRGHSPPRNAIVLCDGCNRAWHQHCHDPPIENDVITIKEKEWLCRECSPVEITTLHPTVVRSNPSLTFEPSIHAPLTLPKIEVGGERFTADDRRRFLSSLSHAALVELLVTISDQHPTVPMFPETMGSLPLSNFPLPQGIISTTTAMATPPFSATARDINPTLPMAPTINDETERPSADPTSEHARKKPRYESSDEESEYEFQEHRLYPRAGNGVRLSTIAEDLDILREDPACPTFSHALYGTAQARVAGTVSA
ncbi:phf1/phf2 family PHD finger domain-containing protein [Aspergillus lucknowensis]|uniref:PHD-type domain-containing protein n=1 Tax=Aspergillus lucknowensis TaxID=176173 RepID=A0ABR4LQD9_9EURO